MRYLAPGLILALGLAVVAGAVVFPEESGWLLFGGITVAVIGLMAVMVLAWRLTGEPPRPGPGDLVLLALAVLGIVATVATANEPVIFFPPLYPLTWVCGGWLLARVSRYFLRPREAG